MASSKKSLQVVYIVLIVVLSLSVNAEPAKFVSTGDSITNGYAPYLPGASSGTGLSVEFTNIANGGLKAPQYTGTVLHRANSELRNYALEVINEQPDYISFMLGTNDCYSDTEAQEQFLAYKVNMQEIFDTFSSASSNSRVYVSTLIPITLSHKLSANDRINEWYNPWIQETVQAYGFNLIDMGDKIQQVSGWQGMYRDGVHLTPEGKAWMADQWIDAINPIPETIPEPASLLLLGMGGLALIRKRNQ